MKVEPRNPTEQLEMEAESKNIPWWALTKWIQISGPNEVQIEKRYSRKSKFYGLVSGTYVFRVYFYTPFAGRIITTSDVKIVVTES